MKVLVADDDLVSRLMLQGAVEALGHECLAADDGEQAWALFCESDPDVVITDWMMPGMDGTELSRRIRAKPGGTYTYLILATSLVERDEVLEGMEAGADDYLTKPLVPFDLEVRLVAAERVTTLHAELTRYRNDLARLACTDPLTQLRNRLSLGDDLATLHARSQRYGRGYCLAMCDVDHFKGYNDTAGHPAGDEVLRAVGATLAAQAREGDGVYRYGGEEFLLALPEQSLRAAAVAAERARRAVEDLGIAHPAAPAPGVVTISIGLAAFIPGDATTSEDLLKAADLALYRAKENGRNRVALAGDEGGVVVTQEPPVEARHADDGAAVGAGTPFRRIVETANLGIWVLDPVGRTTFANAKLAHILGYRREDMAALSLFDVLDEQGRGQAAGNLERRRQGASAQLECAFVRKDGSQAWVLLHASPLHDEVGRYVGSVCMLGEISDRKRIEEALHQREQQLAEAQRVAHLGSWEWDVTADVITWSDELYRIYGLRAQEHLATLDGSLAHVHPDDRETVTGWMEEALLEAGDFEFDYRILRASGEVVWVQARGHVIRDDVGKPLRMNGTVLDITASKRSSEDLATARDAAMESSRLKSEFLTTMSHEIRTPMNGVIGLTGLLLGTELDERQRQYAEGVRGAGESLLAIINDILDFSKIEAGRLEIEVVDFDLVQVVEEAAGLVAGTAQAKGLELVASCAPDLPGRVRGDPARVRQVLLNLVSNAVKFTETGEVVVRARRTEGSGTGVVVRFDVVDTGIGIADGDRQRLFEPFSQADASTTRRFGGTGLGLAISRRLVAAMGGQLEVESEVGRGSTFWFTVPLDCPADGAVAPARLTRLIESLRVLVVDDNDTNRAILREQLGGWDVRPEVVEDGPSALRCLREAAARGDAYDVVLLDMCMPGMDGLELARRISADPALCGPRLMIMTSGADIGAEDARQAGVGSRLTKPVRLSELYDALTREAAPAGSGSPSPTSSVAPAVGGRGRVLVVEDNLTNQLVAVGILEQLGYTADVVGNGLEALDALARSWYAAVLMDCQMPEMDGYTATAEVRRIEGESRRTPIIAMTAGAVEGDRERCLAAGMDDYISKPVTPEDVDAALARWAGEAARGSTPTTRGR